MALALSAALAVETLAAQSAESPVAPPTHAAKAPTLTLAQVLDAAWQRAISAQEVKGELQRAQAERATASALWSAAPALEISQRQDRHAAGGGRETELALAVPLWWPGQRGAQAQRNEAAVAQATASARVERWRLAGVMRELAWEGQALGAEAEAAEAQVVLLAQLSADVDRRVRAGELARADAMAARAEWLAAQAEQAQGLQRLAQWQARWSLLTGSESRVALWLDPAALAEPMLRAAEADHPERVLAQRRLEAAQADLALTRASRRDAPELSFGVRQDSTVRQASAPHSVAVAIRVPFGIESRNRPRDAAAESALALAEVQAQRVAQSVASAVAVAESAWRAAQSQQAAQRERADLLRERARLIERSFRAGETPLPELLRALSAAATAEADAARQRAAWGAARARLEHALGQLP